MDNVEVVKEAYAAFSRGDLPGLMAMFDRDIDWRLAEGHPYAPEGKPFVGPQAITEDFFMKVVSEFDRFIVSPSAFHDAGDTVVVEGRYSALYKATGRDLDAQFCHVWTLRDGRITRFQQYADTARVQAAMADA